MLNHEAKCLVNVAIAAGFLPGAGGAMKSWNNAFEIGYQ
jgi:hypothetical protein